MSMKVRYDIPENEETSSEGKLITFINRTPGHMMTEPFDDRIKALQAAVGFDASYTIQPRHGLFRFLPSNFAHAAIFRRRDCKVSETIADDCRFQQRLLSSLALRFSYTFII